MFITFWIWSSLVDEAGAAPVGTGGRAQQQTSPSPATERRCRNGVPFWSRRSRCQWGSPKMNIELPDKMQEMQVERPWYLSTMLVFVEHPWYLASCEAILEAIVPHVQTAMENSNKQIPSRTISMCGRSILKRGMSTAIFVGRYSILIP